MEGKVQPGGVQAVGYGGKISPMKSIQAGGVEPDLGIEPLFQKKRQEMIPQAAEGHINLHRPPNRRQPVA